MATDLITHEPPVTYWLEQIEGAQKNHRQFYDRGKEVNERYLDKKDELARGDAHTMNVLWSNVETIKPALYAKTPNPKVARRYRDKDPVGKWGAIVLERALGFHLDAYDCDYNFRNCVQDYLLPGRGQVWVTYEPTITEGPPGPDGKPTEQIAWEYAKDEHLNWKDFLHNKARTWGEVWWVAKRAYLTKEEAAAHPILKAKAALLTFDEQKDDKPAEGGKLVNKVAVWEIWCKPKNEVIYVSKNCPELLGKRPPPIKFEGFFPCPRPLATTATTDSIIPTADFLQYQNQADEIDRLTQRINMLTKALRVVGVYDASQESLRTLLDGSNDNQMIPVDNWVGLAQNNGLDGSVDFLPMKDVVDALNQCYISRDQAKQVMYEITGISDIVRGASDPNETLGAQQIKTQWGSLRIRDRQAEVQRFVRDIMRLKSEIMAEHFQMETLKAMSNCPLLMQAEKEQLQQRQQMQQQATQMAQQNPEQAQALLQANPQLQQIMQPLSLDEEQKLREPTWEEVYQLLKDQKLRSFRIDIETDSTVNADETAEKESRIEFVTAATSFIQAWGPIIMQAPQMAPLCGAMLTFATRSFKQADALETEIEAMVDTMNQQAMMQPPTPPEDPAIAEGKAKSELEAKKHEDTMGLEREKMEREDTFRREDAEATRKAQAESEQRSGQEKLQSQDMQSREKVQIAQSQQPKPEDISRALQPIADTLQTLVEQNKELQASMSELVGELGAAARHLNGSGSRADA